MYLNLLEIHACYRWQAAATAAADLLIQQLDSGVAAAGLQYSFIPRRDQRLPWAYGHTSSSSTDAPVTRAAGEKSWSAEDFARPKA